MALRNSNREYMVLAVLLAAAVMVVGGAAALDCPDLNAVYPYWSRCFNPAVYYGQEVYYLTAVGANGSLAPEWDETNSTYYVRLADVGARYILTHLTREYRRYVTQSDNVILLNLDTNRVLGWRQEGEGEYFLVEVGAASDVTNGASYFQFSAADGVSLACPLLVEARCEAYNILCWGTSIALGAYEEDGATYFKQASNSSDAILPFLLLRTTATSRFTSSAGMLKMAA